MARTTPSRRERIRYQIWDIIEDYIQDLSKDEIKVPADRFDTLKLLHGKEVNRVKRMMGFRSVYENYRWYWVWSASVTKRLRQHLKLVPEDLGDVKRRIKLDELPIR